MSDNENKCENCHNRENTSESMLIDLSNQMKEKFEKNEAEVNKLRREKFHTEVEMMSWFGMITALDRILTESSCPPEIQTVSEILCSQATDWVRLRLTESSAKIPDFEILDINVELLPDNNVNE